ncbi:MAG: 1-(5-phosphoribosyl)-5-[(5-phosphoribosylamino)methylideneamino] imidazole-4-carboxamide isomerase [Pseudomonadota bacterium]
MIVYPTMQLQKRRCVTLDRGNLDSANLWHVDPVETAKSWADAGAEWMHLTDLDAVAGDGSNDDLIEEIIRTVGIPVQLGGGMRTRDSVEHWIDLGAARVVMGTLAAQDPLLVKELAKFHPDQIVLTVDVWQGKVMTDGWRTKTAFSPEAFLDEYADAPLAAIVITDINSDVEDVDAQLGLIAGLAAHARTPVIASGVVRSSDDISRLAYVPNISGALVGRALFQRNLTVAEALNVAAQAREPIAEFR